MPPIANSTSTVAGPWRRSISHPNRAIVNSVANA